MVDKEIKKEDIFVPDLTSSHLTREYRFLPIDTKYFKEIEIETLPLFDNLDDILIKSDNVQAFNIMLSNFKQQIHKIYII